MALISIGTDFRGLLRFLIVLGLIAYIFLYFPGSSPRNILPSLLWGLPFGGSVAARYGVDPLDHIDPLIGTINGGKAGTY